MNGVDGVDGVNVMDGVDGVSELSKEKKKKRKRKAKRLKMQENVLMQQKLNLILTKKNGMERKNSFENVRNY